jgi:hypothetical protein
MPPVLDLLRRNDREIVCAALAFVALHFLDAAAIHPVGHVTVTGVVAAVTIPLAGALVYVSLDGPARALVALLFGTFGAVIGLVGVGDAMSYGFTGTAVTGVSFALAGLVLLATFAAVLRRD